MNGELMALLEPVTPEEQKILNGAKEIEKELYTSGKAFIVDSKKMLGKGKLIDIRPHTRFTPFPAHTHNYVEIMYMCRGSTHHVINGGIQVTLEQGDLLMLNQRSSHEILPASRSDIGVNFIILPEFLDGALRMLGPETMLYGFFISALYRDDGSGGFLHFKVADVLPVQNLVENLVWSIVHRQPHDQQINQTTVGLLFLQLANYADKVEQGYAQQQDNHMMARVLEYVETQYQTARLSEIASTLHQPLSTLSTMIKNGSGHTFKELLQRVRLDRAGAYLRDTNLPVTNIIYAVGYDNTSYFHRIFKEAYGMSPKEYRRRFQNGIKG